VLTSLAVLHSRADLAHARRLGPDGGVMARRDLIWPDGRATCSCVQPCPSEPAEPGRCEITSTSNCSLDLVTDRRKQRGRRERKGMGCRAKSREVRPQVVVDGLGLGRAVCTYKRKGM
jgi:hypothetical protein